MKKSYSVGYGKPPEHSRFKPGKSGNPKGRPKGARGVDATLQEELKRIVVVKEYGNTRRLTKLDVMIKSLVNKAVQGDAKALQIVLSRADQHGADALLPGDQEEIDKIVLADYVQRSKART